MAAKWKNTENKENILKAAREKSQIIIYRTRKVNNIFKLLRENNCPTYNHRHNSHLSRTDLWVNGGKIGTCWDLKTNSLQSLPCDHHKRISRLSIRCRNEWRAENEWKSKWDLVSEKTTDCHEFQCPSTNFFHLIPFFSLLNNDSLLLGALLSMRPAKPLIHVILLFKQPYEGNTVVPILQTRKWVYFA